MFSKIKKYVIGFFVLFGGILVAFLSGRSAGKKVEKLKGLKLTAKGLRIKLRNRVRHTEKSLS